MINQNDAEENPAIFLQNGGSAQTPRTDLIGQQSSVPQFGAWENVNNIGYTYFDKKQKTKNAEPTAPENEPQINQDIHPPTQALPPPVKQEARAKVNWLLSCKENIYIACSIFLKGDMFCC